VRTKPAPITIRASGWGICVEEQKGLSWSTFVVATAAVAIVQQINAAVVLALTETIPLNLYDVSRLTLTLHFAIGAALTGLGLWLVVAQRSLNRFLSWLAVIGPSFALAIHCLVGLSALEHWKVAYTPLPLIFAVMAITSLFTLPLVSTMLFGPPRPIEIADSTTGKTTLLRLALRTLFWAWSILVLLSIVLVATGYHDAFGPTVLWGYSFDWSKLAGAFSLADEPVREWIPIALFFTAAYVLVGLLLVSYEAFQILRHGESINRDFSSTELEHLGASSALLTGYLSQRIPLWYRGLLWLKRGAILVCLLGAFLLTAYGSDLVYAFFQTFRAPELWYLYIPVRPKSLFLIAATLAIAVVLLDHIQTYFWPEYRELELRSGWKWRRTSQTTLSRLQDQLVQTLRANDLTDAFDPRDVMRRSYRLGEFFLVFALVIVGSLAADAVGKALGSYYVFTDTYLELPSTQHSGEQERILYTDVEGVEPGCEIGSNGAQAYYVIYFDDDRSVGILSNDEFGILGSYEAVDASLQKAGVPFTPNVAPGCLDQVGKDWDADTRARVDALMHVAPSN
jgi:hypothetical protein